VKEKVVIHFQISFLGRAYQKNTLKKRELEKYMRACIPISASNAISEALVNA